MERAIRDALEVATERRIVSFLRHGEGRTALPVAVCGFTNSIRQLRLL